MSGATVRSLEGISRLRAGREVWATGPAAHPTSVEAPAALLDSLDRKTLGCLASDPACFLGDLNLQNLPLTFRGRPGILMPVSSLSAPGTVMGGNSEVSLCHSIPAAGIRCQITWRRMWKDRLKKNVLGKDSAPWLSGEGHVTPDALKLGSPAFCLLDEVSCSRSPLPLLSVSISSLCTFHRMKAISE